MIRRFYGGRPYNDISVNCGCHEDALPLLRGKLEDGPVNYPAGRLVEEVVLPASWSDMKLLLTYHIVELVSIDPGRIYYDAGLVCSVVCRKEPGAVIIL